VVDLRSGFVDVEMAMAAVENRSGQILVAVKIIYFGCWVVILGAQYPGLKVVMEQGTFSFCCERLLSLVAYIDSVGDCHQ